MRGRIEALSKLIFILLMAAGLAVAAEAQAARKQTTPAKPAVHKSRAATVPVAPPFSLKNLAGKAVRLSDYQGRVVVLNFWATWCGPCQVETPWLVDLREQYHQQGVEVIGVTVDALDDYDPATVAAFVKEHKIPYPIALATPEMVNAYGPITGIPVTLVIDRAGKIRARHRGLIAFDRLEQTIKELL